jgi:hypothetical protein
VINDLKVAIALTERFNESEVIVTRSVLFQVIERMVEHGDGQASLNLSQTNPKYPFMHRVYWHGITFIHFSTEAFLDSAFHESMAL